MVTDLRLEAVDKPPRMDVAPSATAVGLRRAWARGWGRGRRAALGDFEHGLAVPGLDTGFNPWLEIEDHRLAGLEISGVRRPTEPTALRYSCAAKRAPQLLHGVRESDLRCIAEANVVRALCSRFSQKKTNGSAAL